MNKLLLQIFKFGIVGAVCFGIDYGGMVVLTEVFHIYYLVSCAISFSISVVFNYIWSMKYVFVGKKNLSKHKEFIIFVILSILGLVINQGIMWMSVSIINLYYMVAKILATGIVMSWNFITRKMFLEKK